MRALQRRFRKQYAVVGENCHRIAPDVGKARHQRRPIGRLELVEFRPIDNAGDNLADIIGLLGVGWNDAVYLARIVERRHWLAQFAAGFSGDVETGDDIAGGAQRVGVGVANVIGDARNPGVDIGAPQFLSPHRLAGRGLDQRRTAQEYRRLTPHHDRLIGHGRNVSAARRRTAHHHRHLRDSRSRHPRLIIEDAAEMLAVGENLILVGQMRAAGIDQIDAGQAVVAGNHLRPQVLLHRHREIGAALDGGIIGDDHAGPPRDAADAGDKPGARHRIVIKPIGRQRRQFEKGRAGIEQQRHPVPRQKLAAPGMPLPRALAAAQGGGGETAPEIVHQRHKRIAVLAERTGAPIESVADHRHGSGLAFKVAFRSAPGCLVESEPHGHVSSKASTPWQVEPSGGTFSKKTPAWQFVKGRRVSQVDSGSSVSLPDRLLRSGHEPAFGRSGKTRSDHSRPHHHARRRIMSPSNRAFLLPDKGRERNLAKAPDNICFAALGQTTAV